MDTFSGEEDLSDLDDEQPIIGLSTGKGHASSSDEEEEEVYGVLSSGDESSDDDQANDIADDIRSDIEDEENNGLPDSRAWGRKRKNFYNADFVDTNDYGRDPEAAKLEEQEARDIQERLAEQLDAGAIYSLEMLTSQVCQVDEQEKQLEKPADVLEVDEKIVTDLSKLSKRQKLELMRKESPEFFGLVKDFKERMMEVIEVWQPMMRLILEGKLKSPLIEPFVHTNYELILTYCTHVGFYLLLKSKKISVRTHPVIKRLCQLQELLKSLSVGNESLVLQVREILRAAAEGQDLILQPSDDPDDVNVPDKGHRRMKKLLSILGKKGDHEDLSEDSAEEDEMCGQREDVGPPTLEGKRLCVEKKTVVPTLVGAGHNKRGDKHVTFGDEEDLVLGNDGDSDGCEGGLVEGEDTLEEGGKRAITYQMAKNKGLTPRRKKEMRNPRVKHRNQFRKAKIRRKGQVREVYSETSRYGGEISGIKAGVSKSIKIK